MPPAVHRHERAFASAAQMVDVTGDQLFAGAGFADHQHAGLARRDLLQMGEQRLRTRVFEGTRVFEDLRGRPDRGSQSRRGGEGQQLHGDPYQLRTRLGVDKRFASQRVIKGSGSFKK